MKKPSPARVRTVALQDRALQFSVAVNAACPRRFSDVPSATVWRQLVRAADSVSGNLIEADDAGSRADFVHKMRLALRGRTRGDIRDDRAEGATAEWLMTDSLHRDRCAPPTNVGARLTDPARPFSTVHWNCPRPLLT
jgi:hypothetical protein